MTGLLTLALIYAAILGMLWAIGMAGDVVARRHRDRDDWSAQP